MERITIRTPKTLGCSVASTALLQSLRSAFPRADIVVHTRFADLFEHLEGICRTVEIGTGMTGSSDHFDIDLEDYLDNRDVQNSMPRRHLITHMFEAAEASIHAKLDRNFTPLVRLTPREIAWSEAEAKRLSQGKHLVWIQTKTRILEKDVPSAFWQKIIGEAGPEFVFVDLSELQYTRRQAIALTRACFAGITLDSFLLHGSESVHSMNVFVILVSTHKEVVCYADQDALKYPVGSFIISKWLYQKSQLKN